MSQQRRNDAAEAEVGRVLWQSSHDYPDLPDQVAGRLDRVLDSLPAADTLHSAAPARERPFDRWAERLRPKRVRYAVLSATAAVLVTVGAVAAAVQLVSDPGASDMGASSEVQAEQDAGGAAPEATGGTEEEEELGAETNAEEPAIDSEGIAGVETFATGADYDADADLLAALRSLGDGSSTGAVPPELSDLAAGGDFWRQCEEAIVERFEGLVVAVDFARYESEPALIVLLVSDEGDAAVALTPACGEGVVETLAVQP
ncbi:hypothetical protein [Glycomyces paridis]|uniref:Uncharacterized protein n=1 Tax=Glycomyces paridis TaxID=2126555 RepID=A0A4S8P919_9ACTN|nr:hypothetical protein [Glycomyces paridis]THV26730.1 hypothetical protein E9998_17205 [Glycomyces paridis]